MTVPLVFPFPSTPRQGIGSGKEGDLFLMHVTSPVSPLPQAPIVFPPGETASKFKRPVWTIPRCPRDLTFQIFSRSLFPPIWFKSLSGFDYLRERETDIFVHPVSFFPRWS